MLTAEDKALLAEKGISEEQITAQLQTFKKGFPFLKLKAAASVGNGILAPAEEARGQYVAAWDAYKESGKKICKFVPASGAASRMFKNMFEFLDAAYDVPTTDFEKAFFAGLHQFAFFEALDAACVENEGCGADALVAAGKYKAVVACMLQSKGLNYGQLPKGLLQFHKYAEGARTPVEEHLVEAALYASSKGEAEVHFTVSPEHQALFKALVEEKLPAYEKKYGRNGSVSVPPQHLLNPFLSGDFLSRKAPQACHDKKDRSCHTKFCRSVLTEKRHIYPNIIRSVCNDQKRHRKRIRPFRNRGNITAAGEKHPQGKGHRNKSKHPDML